MRPSSKARINGFATDRILLKRGGTGPWYYSWWKTVSSLQNIAEEQFAEEKIAIYRKKYRNMPVHVCV